MYSLSIEKKTFSHFDIQVAPFLCKLNKPASAAISRNLAHGLKQRICRDELLQSLLILRMAFFIGIHHVGRPVPCGKRCQVACCLSCQNRACRIPAFRELRLKIKRHFAAIVAAAKYGISTARVEATNNKIKLLIRTAYGFRNTDSLVSMIMLSCSCVQPRLPGR